ncbi:WAP four-disulfide core domain protein 5-like [Gracilinanus agilis]|uniref:WAP four-disulfide core domain protein 5-like n=1 Tax=Gracilinanus agilis TaxID=191870 RepID=UPI001CFECD12|nr:WAP four-disulfide core domain protein 5-like [Gracilinanus agilis]
MRAQGLLLLAALLVLGSELPGAEGRRKGERSGGCPPDDKACRPGGLNQCLMDKHCPRGEKCCLHSCFLQCMPKVNVKLGQCPTDPLQCLSATQHLCEQDKNCSGLKRCCQTACGRDCRDPARGASLTPQRRKGPWPGFSSPGLLTMAGQWDFLTTAGVGGGVKGQTGHFLGGDESHAQKPGVGPWWRGKP